LIVLDTQHISQLQLIAANSASRLRGRLQESPDQDIRVTVISPYEQLREQLGKIHSAGARPKMQVREFELLAVLLDYYATWRGRILPFDGAAAAILSGFAPKLIRQIGSHDARIAAIALAHDATLLSSNLRDFQQVPGTASGRLAG
jgi:tRNA(fMet)-specific endonuclease VapC